MTIDDGGPAFPYSALIPDQSTRQLVGTMYADNHGMTLWDWYAGKAIDRAMELGSNDESAARIAADMATAMLAERKKRGIGT